MLRLLAQVTTVMLGLLACATAAELDGVVMPDQRDIAGHHLVLNGMGLRTYSLLRVRVYVAGLYLQHRSDDGDTILNSDQTKMLQFVFLRDVDAQDARTSWREALGLNCPVPCSIPPANIERFLAAVPSVHGLRDSHI
jgi:hypothetical protein